jgi:hypothetical protein
MLEFNPQISEIKTIVEILKSQDIYVELFNIDLTTLNSTFSISIGNKYKEYVIEKINELFQDNLIYHKILGGKILVISKIKITIEQKQSIHEYCKKKLNNDNRKFIFINEKTIQKNNLTPNKLLDKYIKIELELNQNRDLMQKNLANLTENKNQELINLWEKAIENSNKITIKLDKENFNQILNFTKNSIYLTNAIYAFAQNFENNKTNIQQLQIEKTILDNVLAYRIWFEVQELLFKGFKIEKINSNIEIRKNKNKKVIKMKFKLQIKFILDWYNATIKSLTPFFNNEQLKISSQIEKELKFMQTLKNEKDIKHKTNKILRKIIEFSNNLDIKGFQSVPIDNLIQCKDAIEFIQKQIKLNFNPETDDIWNELTSKYLNQDFMKSEYKSFIKGDFKPIFQASKYLNNRIIQSTNKQYIMFGFLEIDFFNAFNSYFFPTDTDKFYNQIIDSTFEISNQFISKYPELFKTLTIGLLGDEFFFLFLNQEKFTSTDEKIIRVYLKLISRKMLERTKDKLLIKTEKKIILDHNDNKITIRVPMETDSFFSRPTFQIGKISISKYILIKEIIDFKNTIATKEF